MKCKLCGKDTGRFSGCVCDDCYRRRIRERQQRNYKLITQSKIGKPCAICGVVFPPVCLDYHHVDSSKKEFSLGKNGKDMSEARIYKEIAKCILVCANCHRLLHHQEE